MKQLWMPGAARAIAGAGIAACIGALAVLQAWRSQYFVDAEVALLPWLMSRDWALYRDAVDQHPPLLPALLVPLAGAGDPGLPLRLAIAGLFCLTLCLTYALATALAGWPAGLVAVLIAGLWALPFEVTHLWYDGALAPVYLAAGLLLLALHRARTPGRRAALAFATGLALGAGLLVKQHAGLATLAVGVALWWAPGDGGGQDAQSPSRSPRQVLLLAAGVIIPVLAAAALLAAQGALSDAFYWVIAYSFTGGYAGAAALSPSPGEWPVLAALYAPAVSLLLLCLGTRRGTSGRGPREIPAWLLPAMAGVLVAATLPAWPRYGRFHFQAALPLLSVACGVAAALLADLLRRQQPRAGVRTPAAALAALLLALSFLLGASQLARALALQQYVQPVSAPYASGAAPLRAWVDEHAAPRSPILIYDLDPLLYRVLEREPPRPWVPQLPWIMAGESEVRFWRGVELASPPVALIAAGTWAAAPQAPPSNGARRGAEHLEWLQRGYREAARFEVINYSGAPRLPVIGLLKNDGAAR